MIVSIGQEFGVTLIGVIASMRIAGGALLVASVLCFTHANPAEAGLPKWFSQASEIETPAYAESSHALILFRERRVEVEKSGRVNLEERCVLRVLTEEGGQQARASVFYRTDHEEVTALRAWLVDPLGRQEQYGEGDAFDVALLDEALYSEARVRSIVPSDEVGPGVVFGYEYELEIEPLFYQFEWDVSRGLPAVEARFALKLPKGWKVDSRFRKLPTVTPLPGKKEVIWVFEELPEPTSPIGSVSAKDWPSFGVSCWVDGEESGLSSMCFREWGEVSNWLDRLSEPSAEINGEMLSLAQNLVAGVRGELDTLRAVAEYVQDLRYVAIEMGLGRGGGYRPRPAPEVLRTSYGDCKDKSNLMRTLLRALGKQSYLMAIYSGDATRVDADWVSPQQFNHCILAIPLRSNPRLPAVKSIPGVGATLLFDPTDPETVLGDLPASDQGGFALLIGVREKPLVRAQRTSPETNRLNRRLVVELEAAGSAVVQVDETVTGQLAARERHWAEPTSGRYYQDRLEERMSYAYGAVDVHDLDLVNDEVTGDLMRTYEFTVADAARTYQDELLVIRPAKFLEWHVLAGYAEDWDVNSLLNERRTESVALVIPPGFRVDEVPEASSTTTEYATYSAKYMTSRDTVWVVHSLRWQPDQIRPVDLAKVMEELAREIRDARKTVVVLARE